ncbi:MAG: PspC domain-containing protein [Oscillospiraceae bacterium]|nr:PspC domain-containing protein [Oscillospiraceae bacterium]
MKKFYRSTTNRHVTGVCGGIGEYFNIDPTLVRVVYTLLSIFSAGFPGVLGYILLTAIIPKRPVGRDDDVPQA